MKLTSKVLLSAFTAFAFVATPACDGGDKKDDKKADAKKDDKKADAKADEKKADEKKADEKKADEKGADGGGAEGAAEKIGVAACDEYVEKYTACIPKMPAGPAQDTAKKSMEDVVKGWKELAAGAGKETLEATCKSMIEAAKKSTEQFKCEW